MLLTGESLGHLSLETSDVWSWREALLWWDWLWEAMLVWLSAFHSPCYHGMNSWRTSEAEDAPVHVLNTEILSSSSVGLCPHCSSAMGREFLRSWGKVEGGDRDAEWGGWGSKRMFPGLQKVVTTECLGNQFILWLDLTVRTFWNFSLNRRWEVDRNIHF